MIIATLSWKNANITIINTDGKISEVYVNGINIGRMIHLITLLNGHIDDANASGEFLTKRNKWTSMGSLMVVAQNGIINAPGAPLKNYHIFMPVFIGLIILLVVGSLLLCRA